MSHIFIGYAREDRSHAKALAAALKSQGWPVWWDVRIPAGKTFDDVIEEKLEAATCVIVLWSQRSVEKQWVRAEAQEGLDRGILVPVLIEADVKIPLAFRRIQAANLIGWDGSEPAEAFQDLVADIAEILGQPPSAPGKKAKSKTRRKRTVTQVGERQVATDIEELIGIEWVDVRTGTFQMGSEQGYSAERPVHQVTLTSFKISRFPITNVQYERFVKEARHSAPRHWTKREIPDGKDHHPVVCVSWHDAQAYCSWLGGRVGLRESQVRLPTEAQWEFAARGEEGRLYPWGDAQPTHDHANFGSNVGDTTPVGKYPKGATPSGIHDLAGNVWEWCGDWYGPYDKRPQVDPSGPEHGSSRMLRGGSFFVEANALRASSRDVGAPGVEYVSFGFRVVFSSAGGLNTS